jgi:hypothetical protein
MLYMKYIEIIGIRVFKNYFYEYLKIKNFFILFDIIYLQRKIKN